VLSLYRQEGCEKREEERREERRKAECRRWRRIGMPRCYYSRSKARRRIGEARSNPRFISQSVTPGLLLQGLPDLSAFAGWKQFVPKAETTSTSNLIA